MSTSVSDAVRASSGSITDSFVILNKNAPRVALGLAGDMASWGAKAVSYLGSSPEGLSGFSKGISVATDSFYIHDAINSGVRVMGNVSNLTSALHNRLTGRVDESAPGIAEAVKAVSLESCGFVSDAASVAGFASGLGVVDLSSSMKTIGGVGSIAGSVYYGNSVVNGLGELNDLKAARSDLDTAEGLDLNQVRQNQKMSMIAFSVSVLAINVLFSAAFVFSSFAVPATVLLTLTTTMWASLAVGFFHNESINRLEAEMA